MRRNDFQTSGFYRLVRRFRVRFRVRPIWLAVDEQSAEAGFVLELYGSHDVAWNHEDHSCAICRTMLVALLAIADRVLTTNHASETNSQSTTRYVASPDAAEMKVEKTVTYRRSLCLANDGWALQIVEQTCDALHGFGCREIRQEPDSTDTQAHFTERLETAHPSACSCAG